jgi:hypothetical protein
MEYSERIPAHRETNTETDMRFIAQNLVDSYSLSSRLVDLVEIAHGGTGNESRHNAAVGALEIIIGLPEADVFGDSDRDALTASLRRIIKDTAVEGYTPWTDSAKDLRYDGVGFATVVPKYGPAYLVMRWLDRGLCGKGGRHRLDPLRGELDGLYVDPAKIAKRSRNKFQRGTSQRAVEGVLPVLREAGLIVVVRRERYGKIIYAPAWLGETDPDVIRGIMQAALEKLVTRHQAGGPLRGHSGSLNSCADEVGEIDSVRTWCEPSANLEIAQPTEKQDSSSAFGGDTNTYTSNISFIEGDYRVGAQVERISPRKKAVHKKDQNGSGGGGKPPATSLPAFAELLISDIGEQSRSVIEKQSRSLLRSYGGDAVAPFFRDAAQSEWESGSSVMAWVTERVTAAVSRGDIPEAGIALAGMAQEGVA